MNPTTQPATDAMLYGRDCEICAERLDGEAVGYPRPCSGCLPGILAAAVKEARRRWRNRQRNREYKERRLLAQCTRGRA